MEEKINMPSKKIIALLVAVLLIAPSFLINTDWEVSHQIEIKASPANVWRFLADLESYPEWNRYSPSVTGKLAVGEVVYVEAHLDQEVRQVQNFVLSIKPEQELCWQSGDWFAHLANGVRCRWLTPTEDGGTLLVHHEIMQGPLAWLIERLYRPRIERGLALVDTSLAEYAEKYQRQN